MSILRLIFPRAAFGCVVLIAMFGLAACGGADDKTAVGSLLDRTFGTNGKVTTPIGGHDFATGVVVLSDGKIMVAGYSSTITNYDFSLARYNTDGSLDTTFGTNGYVTTDIGGYADIANAMAIQGDGKIVVAGFFWNGTNNDIAVVRYNANGSLDTTFDTDGKVTTAIGAISGANAVAIQGDGKIVLAGFSWNGANENFVVVRYNTDGSLDTTFDTDGLVTTAIGTNSRARAVAIQGDGKIVVAGISADGSNGGFALARYNANGSLDTTFDTDGKVTTAIGADDYASAVAIQGDGKIVAAGSSTVLSSVFALARYNSDGSLDTTFDTDGKVTTAIGADDYASAMAIQSNGKIVVAGASLFNYADDFALARYNADGSLDTTFQMEGKATTAIGGDDKARAVAIQSDGKIVAVGESWSGSPSNSDFALVRYLP